MTTWPVRSVPDPAVHTFPHLTDAQIARARTYGVVRQVSAGGVLWKPGDTGISFFIMLSGKLDIFQPDFNGIERLIVTHDAGEFTGEVTMISGQPALVLSRVSEAGEFLEIKPDALRTMISRDAELSEVVMRAFILRRIALVTSSSGNVVVLGSRFSAGTLHVREFLGRNGYPYSYLDLDTDKLSQQMLDRFQVTTNDIPVVVCDGTHVLRSPSIQELADCLGLNSTVNTSDLRDLIIVGAGPAGLAAAVYAASEGLDALMVEPEAPGGQAGSSSKIENYLGFPTGISGQELASRAIHQAQKFGAKLMVAHRIQRLDCDHPPYRLVLDDGTSLSAKSIIIATGAQYNRPALPNLKQFEGQGIYYGATYIESQLCGNDPVIVVGGGNSAGQAAVFLSQTARRVHMLVRSGGLAESMSRYLIQRITENPNIELHFNTELVGLEGNGRLQRVAWRDKTSGETSQHDISHVFMMAGASPRTEWLRGCVELDDKGFILTGRDLLMASAQSATGTSKTVRPPHMLETNLPGVFAVGDVRSGSVKRVASAVGEGAIAVHLVHRFLAEA